MLLRISSICQRSVNPSTVIFSKFCTQFAKPTFIDTKKKGFNKKDKNSKQNETHDDDKSKTPIIVCKRKEFNFYKGQTFSKFDTVPLASGAWSHQKSKGDFFTIYPLEENSQEEVDSDVTFEDLGVRDELIASLQKYFNIEKPTTIQQMAIPQIANHQNTKLAAETGCGKTLAYLLPLVEQVIGWKTVVERKFNHPLALIITPSRELAFQIGREARRLTRDLDIRTKVIVGGSIKKKVLNPPVSDVDIVVASLGGLSKHVTLGLLKTRFVRHVILDEADSLFDETFYDKLTHFLKKMRFGPVTECENSLPKYSQMTLVSATMPQHLDEILENIVDPDSLLEVKTEKLHRIYAPQRFLRLGPQQKPMALLKLVKKKGGNKSPIIIFTNNSDTCNWVSMFLDQFNVRNITLNGQMTVHQRKNKFVEFQSGRYNVLCTTDAGSRGLDTVMVKEVINYDFPLQTSEYIHRCGRTARVGSPKDCRVINFVARPLEILLVQRIEKATRLMKTVPILDYLKRNWAPEVEDEGDERPIHSREDDKEKDFTSGIEESDGENDEFRAGEKN